MEKVTINTNSKKSAIKKCQKQFGWTPSAVRKVDSGDENTKAYMCFESAQDAELWDNQK